MKHEGLKQRWSQTAGTDVEHCWISGHVGALASMSTFTDAVAVSIPALQAVGPGLEPQRNHIPTAPPVSVHQPDQINSNKHGE